MPNTCHIRILVVEDERVIAADLCECLSDMGYQVVGEAASGEEALRKVARHRPDLVLMDIVLDGEMDGITAAERLQREYDVPVIFLTSHADTGTIRRATSDVSSTRPSRMAASKPSAARSTFRSLYEAWISSSG